MVATAVQEHSSGISSADNNNTPRALGEDDDDISTTCSVSSFTMGAEMDFDSMPEEQVRIQAHKLSERYKLLLKECDSETAHAKELRKRVKNLESEKVSFSSKYTDEICQLLSENTVLKSKLERVEAGKQNQDFQSVSKIQNLTADLNSREEQLKVVNNALNKLRGELNNEVSSRKELEHEMDMRRQEYSDKKDALENKLECIIAENKSLKTEKNALTQKVADQNNLIKSLEEKVAEMVKDNQAVESDWKHTKDEFDTFVVCADDKQAELIKRVEELENQLMKETSEKNRMADKTEKITNQLTDLIRSYENSKHENGQLAQELIMLKEEKMRVESSFKSSKHENDQLKRQLADYEQNFNSIRVELEHALKRQRMFENTYSDSFKNLELVLFQHSSGGTSNRQKHTAGSSANPIGGRRTHERAEARNKKGRGVNELPTKDNGGVELGTNGSEVEPNHLVESVASMLQHYNAQVETSRSENTALVDRLKAVTTEIDSYKEAVDHSKRVLDELKEQLANKSHEAAKLKRENAELEQKVSSVSQQARESGDAYEKQKSRADKLSDQMLVFKKKAKLEEETKKKQLLSVGVKLASMRSMGVEDSNSIRTCLDSNVSEYSEWELILNNVMEQLDSYTSAYKSLIDKYRKLDFACVRKDEALDDLQSNHESEMSSLKGQLAHQTQTHNNHQSQLEEHYQLMVEDLKNKLKVLQDNQKWSSESADKIVLLENVRTSQEIEIGELKELLIKSQNNAQSFQLALCLLSSVLWPTFDRLNALISQQHMLLHYYTESEQTAHQIAKLVTALNNELQSDDESDTIPPQRDLSSKRRLPPVLKFRRCVIAVLAANRLIRIANDSSLCFTVDDHLVGGPNCRLSVYIGQGASSHSNGNNIESSEFSGNLKKNKKGMKSRKSNQPTVVLREPKEKIQSHQVSMINWLTDNGFPYKVVTSLNDLLTFVQTNSVDSDGSQKQLKGILTQTRNCFVQLVSRLSQHFETCSPLAEISASLVRERSSLAQRLLKGLHSTMLKMTPAQRAVYVPVQHNLSAVQTKMIELCERISCLEEDRARVEREMANLRSENGHLASVRDRADILQKKLDTLKAQSDSMVNRDKYNKVCGELDSALLREKQAEDLLKEQGEHLLNMGRQLESKHKDESSREISLAESARELCEVKLELSKKTHEIRGLSRKMEELQLEKSRLQQSMTSADINARCAVRDGDMVSCYVKAVNESVEGFKNQLIYSPSTLNTLTLPHLDEVLSGNTKYSNELKICHELVLNFGDTLGHLTTHLHNQSNQIRTQKENIAALKQELLVSTKPPMHPSYSSGFHSNGKQLQSSATFSNSKQNRQRTPDSDYGGSSFHSHSAFLMSSSSVANSPLMFSSTANQNQGNNNHNYLQQGLTQPENSAASLYQDSAGHNSQEKQPTPRKKESSKRTSLTSEHNTISRKNSQRNSSSSSLNKVPGNQRSPVRVNSSRR